MNEHPDVVKAPILRDDDPGLLAFREELKTKVMGSYWPGGAPTIINPLSASNPFPVSTKYHEEIHQELMMGTTFGGFFIFLTVLAKTGHFTQEALTCYKNQWEVQEGCATYRGMSVIANECPDRFEAAVNALPSLLANQSPYREVFGLTTAFLPIVPGSDRVQLGPQDYTIQAIGCCSLNSDCYEHFKSPDSLTEQSLEAYLKENSPNLRFHQIFKTLGKERIENLVEDVRGTFALKDFNPVRHVIRKIASLIPQLKIVVELEQIKEQHHAFCDSWKEKYRECTGKPLEIGPGMRKHTVITQPTGQISTTQISLSQLRDFFRMWEVKGAGVWVVIYMQDTFTVKLDVFAYEMDSNFNPASEMNSLSSYMNYGFVSGTFSSADVFALFRDFPKFPHAISFIKWSWQFWIEAGGGQLKFQNSVQACLNRTLRIESIKIHTMFHNLGQGLEFFIIGYDESQAVVCLTDPRRPGIYALQYIAGEAGFLVFDQIAPDFGIRKMTSSYSTISHLPLLRLMSFPGFVQADPDGKKFPQPIIKLLKFAKATEETFNGPS